MLATQDSNKLAVTKEEAAKLLSIGVTVLDRLAKAGKIKPFRIGKRGVRYPVSELQRYVQTAIQESQAEQACDDLLQGYDFTGIKI